MKLKAAIIIVIIALAAVAINLGLILLLTRQSLIEITGRELDFVFFHITIGNIIFLSLLVLSVSLFVFLKKSGKQKAALKKAQETNRVKNSFLANVSHEMRTPLNAIIGLSELILNNGGTRADIEEKLERVYQSSLALRGIVNDILDISKIESGRFDLRPAEYETANLINDIVSVNTVRIKEKPVDFILLVDEKLPLRLFGDDLRIKQIFNNLLSNALKFTCSGTVEWTVSFERDGSSIWLLSDVKDTGEGIKPEDIPKLFQDYSQVDTQSHRKTEGTGLGLSIVKSLVDMMDGTISVKSKYGKGSIFSVRLRQGFVSDAPIGKETADNLMAARFNAAGRTRSAGLTRADLSYANVLVVDDMLTNLDVLKSILMPYGMRVDCATSGRQAIDMIRAESPRYDAVFMDHLMPGMDGIEAAHIIREEIGTEYARKLPIVALTANAITGHEKLFLENGFQTFVSKPIDIIQMDAILRRWVRNKAREGSGFDKAAGIACFAGSEKVYVNVLSAYAVNTRSLLADLGKYLAAGNIADYIIAIHGIKGSSLCVGASRAGEKAGRLEQAARAGLTEKLQGENSDFVKYMEGLLDSIDAELAASKSGQPI